MYVISVNIWSLRVCCVDSAGPGAGSELTLAWPRLRLFALVTFDHHQTFICVITWKQIVETKNYRNVKLFEIQLNIKCCESLRSAGIFNLTFSDYKTWSRLNPIIRPSLISSWYDGVMHLQPGVTTRHSTANKIKCKVYNSSVRTENILRIYSLILLNNYSADCERKFNV